MALVIGTDEAGYGPNLGPLLISATTWRVPDEQLGSNLFELLSPAVGPSLKDDAPITIADSKDLYKPGGDLSRLEQGLLPALRICGDLPDDWQGIWSRLAPVCAQRLMTMPWHEDHDAMIPHSADRELVEENTNALKRAAERSEVELLDVKCRAMFPEEFNDLVDQCDSKGEVLSRATLALVEDQLAAAGDEPVLIQCDKHGGRNRYSPLLQCQFPDYLVEIVEESRAESIYRWGPGERRVEIRFTAKGERFLPSALASMACKYLRELAMEAFNVYWSNKVDNLKPTAGYPVDAKRFRADIQTAQAELGISDRILWRCR